MHLLEDISKLLLKLRVERAHLSTSINVSPGQSAPIHLSLEYIGLLLSAQISRLVILLLPSSSFFLYRCDCDFVFPLAFLSYPVIIGGLFHLAKHGKVMLSFHHLIMSHLVEVFTSGFVLILDHVVLTKVILLHDVDIAYSLDFHLILINRHELSSEPQTERFNNYTKF